MRANGFDTRGTPHVFSFESVCAFLGIDPNWLRERLESLAPSDLPSKQFRTHRRRLARPSRIRTKEDAVRHNRRHYIGQWPRCVAAVIPHHRRASVREQQCGTIRMRAKSIELGMQGHAEKKRPG